jgi:hypothetical protein
MVLWRQNAVLLDVALEMKNAVEQGYTPEHDDEHGSAHLVQEAVHRLTHIGEVASPESARHEVIVAIGLLFNAVATLDRGN